MKEKKNVWFNTSWFCHGMCNKLLNFEFIGGAFYIKPFEIEGKKVEDIDNEEWFLLYTVNIDTLKVIGNVHENLELLGEKRYETYCKF